MQITKDLKLADYVTLLALIFGVTANYFLIKNNTYIAINFWLLAFCFDLLDGYVARNTKPTSFGAHLDSHGDVFIYLIFNAILFYKFFNNSIQATLLLSMIIIVFGIIRLVRFSISGTTTINNGKFYVGIPVYVPLIATLSFYFIKVFYTTYNQLAFVVVFTLSILMPSQLKFKYTRNKIILFALVTSILILNTIANIKGLH